jgi:VWFA-related protein
MQRLHVTRWIFVLGFIAAAGYAQSVVPHSTAVQGKGVSAVPGPTFRSYSRLVTLEVVVKDSKGKHFTGLKPGDFQVLEETPSESKEKREQKIAQFREVQVNHLGRSAASMTTRTAPDIYTNAMAIEKNPVPATILLVDGLNTTIQDQAQVHTQMLKMLRQLPGDVPVAVFLLGDRLTMLQGFTTDPQLLQRALGAANSNAGKGIADVNPTDDPYAAGNSMGGFDHLHDPSLASVIAAIQQFDQHVYATQMTARVNRTAEAFISLSRNVAGYPGRKNVLWMSTAFPINVNAFSVGDSASQADYQGLIGKMNRALSDAHAAVYPIYVGGVETLQTFRADALPPDVSSAGISGAIQRNVEQINSQQDVMEKIAAGTGGKVCAGSNELSDCVRKAVDDSSHYYEISYYPDSPMWNGAYRNIILKSHVHGAHLVYRNWYLARGEENPDPKLQSRELQADCDDYLDATAVPFTAARVRASSPDTLQFSLRIDPSALAFVATADGDRSASLEVAVCTLNEKRWPLKIMMYPVNLSFTAQQYDAMQAAGGVTQAITVPAPRPAAVRLLVKDMTTGKLGSILIRTQRIESATR